MLGTPREHAGSGATETEFHLTNILTTPDVAIRAAFGILKVSNIEPLSGCGTSHHLALKTKELSGKQILSVPCTICGAAIKEPCKLNTGALRTEPHRDRKLSAAEAVEQKF